MSKQTKIIIGVVAGISVLCLIACVIGAVLLGRFGTQVAGEVEKSVSVEPGKVNDQAAGIADFTLPAGFEPETSMDMFGIKIAVYSNRSANQNISLLQMPTRQDVTEENIGQMRDSLERSTSRNLKNLRTVETRELTIRGKPAQLIIQEGTKDGADYRQMMVAFQGKSGLAMLMAMGPKDGWDQAGYDALVASIH